MRIAIHTLDILADFTQKITGLNRAKGDDGLLPRPVVRLALQRVTPAPEVITGVPHFVIASREVRVTMTFPKPERRIRLRRAKSTHFPIAARHDLGHRYHPMNADFISVPTDIVVDIASAVIADIASFLSVGL